MAKPEATEKPTAKRLSEARARGQIAKSQDIPTAVVFLAVIITLHVGFQPLVDGATRQFATQLGHVAAHRGFGPGEAGALILGSIRPYLGLMTVVGLTAVVLGVLSSVAQTGLTFNLKKLQPNFGSLNPLSGLKRVLFSPQTLVNLGKQLVKLIAVGTIIYGTLHDKISLFYALAHATPRDVAFTVEGLLYEIGFRFGIVLLLLGLLDFLWSRKQLNDSLKMTKGEVKDESKQAEGSPEAKGEVRKRRFAARKRMMAAVPTATVVVTNPTHFAVALHWDDVTMAAPVVVAKGADLMARRIKQLAAEHDVPVMENAPLARTLYNTVPLDSPVPADLYAAVAQMIAFVYRLKNKTIA